MILRGKCLTFLAGEGGQAEIEISTEDLARQLTHEQVLNIMRCQIDTNELLKHRPEIEFEDVAGWHVSEFDLKLNVNKQIKDIVITMNKLIHNQQKLISAYNEGRR